MIFYSRFLRLALCAVNRASSVWRKCYVSLSISKKLWSDTTFSNAIAVMSRHNYFDFINRANIANSNRFVERSFRINWIKGILVKFPKSEIMLLWITLKVVCKVILGRINWKIGEFFLSQQAKSDAFDCRVVHIVFKRVKILVVAHVRQGLCDPPDFQGVFDGKQIPQLGKEIGAGWENSQPLYYTKSVKEARKTLQQKHLINRSRQGICFTDRTQQLGIKNRVGMAVSALAPYTSRSAS